jgi:hypothetical protein
MVTAAPLDQESPGSPQQVAFGSAAELARPHAFRITWASMHVKIANRRAAWHSEEAARRRPNWTSAPVYFSLVQDSSARTCS